MAHAAGLALSLDLALGLLPLLLVGAGEFVLGDPALGAAGVASDLGAGTVLVNIFMLKPTLVTSRTVPFFPEFTGFVDLLQGLVAFGRQRPLLVKKRAIVALPRLHVPLRKS